jgi:hypothetical protein
MVTFLDRIIGPSLDDMRAENVLGVAQMMLQWRQSEKQRLDKIHAYVRGTQDHPFAPVGAPLDVRKLAQMSRVNVLKIVISSMAQTLYVDGYRQTNEGNDAPVWQVWQANAMDAKQTGIHRAAMSYGASYATVLPGDPVPVIRGYSPRFMTAVYDDDDDEWPLWALRAIPNRDRWAYRLYDANAVHYLESDANGGGLTVLESRRHNIGVTPVVRYLNEMDLDEDNDGEIEPLMDLQDQIDHTTFGLKVAEHFGAFKQRAVMGWVADSEEQLLKASAQRLWAFDDPDVKLHEFTETDLSGYLNSRESAVTYAAVLSQVPAHYLLGKLVNLSAEALVAAEASLIRKSRERQHSFGESHERALSLAARIGGIDTTIDAQVRWADPEQRTFGAVTDALLKLRDLGVPVEMLLEKVPWFSQTDVERAKILIADGSPLDMLTNLLNRQAAEEIE